LSHVKGFPAADLYDSAAELRSQELTRVAAYPQGPLRKLKADENDIFNGMDDRRLLQIQLRG
jgi:hypothetical protein